ncbi:MAG: high-affinity branched-chain amino acid ABC transporter permease LivM [Proteobacteria bacterium]|nr:high-affinity branched-chain amino acid ABC transporter permease LivM [Pseudomonadota bacterium]
MAAIGAGAERQLSFGEMIRDAAAVALVALGLALPLVGFQTVDRGAGMILETRFGAMFYAVGVIFVGRFVLGLIDAGRGRPILAASGAFSAAWVLNAIFDVAPPIEHVTLGWLTWLVAMTIALRAWFVLRRGARPAGRDGTRAGALPAVWLERVGRLVVPAALTFAVVMPFLPFADQRLVDLGILVLTYTMLGWGLNVVVGLAGLLDLGYVAFYAVGAYSYALISINLGLNFWETLPFAGAVAAFFGVALGFPVLRLRGDYLAIVTLGFGEMIRLILLNWDDLSNGAKGIGDIPRPSFFGLQFTAAPREGVAAFHEYFDLDFSPIHRVIYLYYIILILALLTNWFTLRIRKLPIGRAWEALREDEIACRALGINPTTTKLTAFAIGATFGGFAGSFFATRQGFISPESFNFIESAIILAIVVLGGMGSQLGVVVASVVLIGGPEWFRDLGTFRMVAFGALMVAVMIWRPQGLLAHRDPTVRLPAAPGRPP